ncbi:MAG: Mu transposase C-terminal domain-containing protein, partial [Rikenellaceae bacterium]
SVPQTKEKIEFSQLTPHELQICSARHTIVQNYREFATKNSHTGVTKAKRSFVELYASKTICKEQYDILGAVSFQTIERWNKELRENGEKMDALVPSRREKRGSSLLDEQRTRLVDLYSMPNKFNISSCYRFAVQIWNTEELPIPSEATCRRFLEDWIRNNIAIATFRREGLKAVKDRQLPYLERNANSIEFFDVLVADGRRMEFQMAHPTTGKPCRPTLVAWQDMRTGLVIGFELMVTENTMSVVSSFRQACINAGKLCGYNGAILPRSIYMDNGRAFKNKFLIDKVNLENKIGGLFERLKSFGLEHIQYAEPYNASSKVIERSFEDFGELDKMIPSYVGNCIANKPARMMRNEVYHKNEYEKAISKNGLPTLWGAYRFIEWWLTTYNTRISNGRYLQGKSPMELASAQIETIDFSRRQIKGNELDYMIMNSVTKKRKRNGFKINGVWYYNTLMANVAFDKCEYIVKYDVLDTSRVLVYNEDGTFWCEAVPWIGQNIHAMAALGSDADRKQRNDALRTSKAIRDSIVSAAKNSSKDATALLLGIGNAPQLTSGNPLAVAAPNDEILTDIRLF